MARLKTRIPQIFNVEQYGAKADGVTDDSVAIQAAIDNAYSVGGGRVQLMLGNHKILSTLVMKYHVELIGHGVKKTKLTVPAGVDGINIVKLAGDSTDFHLLLQDFSLEGGGIAGAGTQRGIAFVTDGYFAHINFKRLRVIGFNGDGIQSSVALFPNQSVFVGTIEDVRVQQCSGHAFVFEVGTTLNFTACYASACRKSGFRMKSQAYGSIHDSASEECGIAFEMIGNQCFNIYSSGSELTSDYSLAYPGICLSDTGCSSCNYIGLYLQRFDNAGGGNNIRKYLKFDGSFNCNVMGLRLKADSLGVQVPNFSYEIINGAKVNLSQVTVNGLPANLAKVGGGEFKNIIASELHGSNSYSHFWRVDEQIDYQVLSADLTLTNDSPGVLHVNGGLGTRVVVLPIPTLVAPNLHGMTFNIKNIGTTNNIEIREGTPTGTLRGTLLPGEWATYRWDTNFPRYFEWRQTRVIQQWEYSFDVGTVAVGRYPDYGSVSLPNSSKFFTNVITSPFTKTKVLDFKVQQHGTSTVIAQYRIVNLTTATTLGTVSVPVGTDTTATVSINIDVNNGDKIYWEVVTGDINIGAELIVTNYDL